MAIRKRMATMVVRESRGLEVLGALVQLIEGMSDGSQCQSTLARLTFSLDPADNPQRSTAPSYTTLGRLRGL